jgi:hypothetical protein
VLREFLFESFGMCHTYFGFDGSVMSRIEVPLNSILPVMGLMIGFSSWNASWWPMYTQLPFAGSDFVVVTSAVRPCRSL